MASALVMANRRRSLHVCVCVRALVRRFCHDKFTLLLDADSRPGVLSQFKQDYETFYLLDKVGQAWSKEWVSRSPFQRMTVKQVGLAFNLEHWAWTERMASLVHHRQTRIIGQQIVEDSFNKLKAGVDLGSNSRCLNDRSWAIPIDRGVISGVHRYKEVDRSQIRYARNAEIDACQGWALGFGLGIW